MPLKKFLFRSSLIGTTKGSFFAAIALIIVLGVTTLISPQPSQLVLWSWQRQDNVSFVNKNTLIAPLVGTIAFNGNNFQVFPRSNPLTLETSAQLIPVVRLEIKPGFFIDDKTLEKIIFHILALTQPCKAKEIQIDFDATTSQRSFYAKLLTHLRIALPNTRLSITALASWCLGDPWIENLPIDYAVPMVYNLGEDLQSIKRFLLNTKKWKACKCRGYIGLNRKDIFIKVPKGWTIFIFNDEAWTLRSYESLLKEIL